jgi:hypothetical protein
MIDGRTLLLRDEFRARVFQRDKGRCVLCSAPAVDAHHILERRLWPDGGYYLDNGASVCGACHLECEMTAISVESVRYACDIQKPIIPAHLYDDQPYDKWGNPILPNGNRLRGELFFDESVQKILARGGFLDAFQTQVKYPRTYHLPWSQGMSDDDRMMPSLDHLSGQPVIITEKMDGENTTFYQDYIHARSIDGRDHVSRHWVKNFWADRASSIPSGWRICGENLFAKHSIGYSDLPSYFLGFSVWDERNTCLSWDATLEWLELLGIQPVRTVWRGLFDEKKIRTLWDDSQWSESEGYVVRVDRAFFYSEFRHVVGKFVRAGHVQTTKHWMHGQKVERNFIVGA